MVTPVNEIGITQTIFHSGAMARVTVTFVFESDTSMNSAKDPYSLIDYQDSSF